MSRILRYEVPVDDEWHIIRNVSPALHVACRRIDVVEFWAHPLDQTGTPVTRAFRVHATGQEIDDDEALYVGTALTPPDGRFVWHLMAKWVTS